MVHEQNQFNIFYFERISRWSNNNKLKQHKNGALCLCIETLFYFYWAHLFELYFVWINLNVWNDDLVHSITCVCRILSIRSFWMGYNMSSFHYPNLRADTMKIFINKSTSNADTDTKQSLEFSDRNIIKSHTL